MTSVYEQIVHEVHFREYAEASGQVLCPDPGYPCGCAEAMCDHTVLPLMGHPCPSCKAVV